MAEKSYFFNDVNDDRVYLAEDFAMFFSTLIGNGVFPNPSTNTQVLVNEETPMSITIKPGFAWINGYMYWNPDNLVKTLAAAYTNPRIDRVVIRWSSNSREIRTDVITGIPAAVPVAPELTRNSDVWELGIADIFVGGGVTSITQANITDTRLSNALCGIVHALVDQVDTEDLFIQFQDAFQIWFESVKSILNEDVAGNLLSKINDNTDDIEANVADIAVHTTAISNLKKFQTAGGTGTAITLSNVELIDGFQITFVIENSNNGSATSINGMPLYKPGTTTAPKLIAGKAATVWYNSAGGCFFIKASAEGTALAGDVLAGKTFSNDDDTGVTGILSLTGTAAVGEVVKGKTFYSSDAKTKLTGTGANAKRWASGSILLPAAPSTFTPYSITGIGFKPSVLILIGTSYGSYSVLHCNSIYGLNGASDFYRSWQPDYNANSNPTISTPFDAVTESVITFRYVFNSSAVTYKWIAFE